MVSIESREGKQFFPMWTDKKENVVSNNCYRKSTLDSRNDLNLISLSKKSVVERLSSELLTVKRGLVQAVSQFLTAGVHQVEHHLHFTRSKHWS